MISLTGLGVTFPLIMIVSAFTNLFGQGGAPLCSIARGEGDIDRAERIMEIRLRCFSFPGWF